VKEEIRRIMQLVKDGKLSPEDAAELIEAFEESPDETAPVDDLEEAAAAVDAEVPPVEEPAAAGAGKKSSDPFAKLVESIEKITNDVAKGVNWKDVADQVREGVNKGVDAIKQAADEARQGKGPFGVVFSHHTVRTVELPLSVPEGKLFRIEGHTGDVKIEGGYDIGAVTIDATFRAYNTEEAEAAAERYTPLLEETADAVTLRQPEGHGVSADVTVKLPKGTPVNVRIQTGDCVVTGTHASVKVECSSGDIRVREGAGAIELRTVSGDIRLNDCASSSVTLETKSGDVILDKTDGSTTVRTASGDVTAYQFSGRNLSIEAASGSITADLAKPVVGNVNIRTVSGDISLMTPDGNDARVTLSTLRGDVNCAVELADLTESGSKITGRLGEGSGVIDVSAVNGDVSFNFRDATVG